jgi:(p)ppGpp synthase/HD superfamily hydrolase
MEDNNCWELKYEPCDYSTRLLGKVSDLNAKKNNKVNIIEVKKAIHYAKKYHGLQLRDSGDPYYSHPLEVAYMVADYIFETNSLVTSILHDTIEDTELSEQMIDSIFGSLIASHVKDLTRIKDGRKISLAEIIEPLWLQKNMTYYL